MQELQRAITLAGGSTETRAGLAMAHAAAGEHDRVRSLVDGLLYDRPTHFVVAYYLAKIYAAAGDAAEALSWLRIAFEEMNPDLIELVVEPLLDGIRGMPEFEEIRRRLPRG